MRVPCLLTIATLAVVFLISLAAQASASVVANLSINGGEKRAEILIEGAFTAPDYSVRAANDGRTVVIDVADSVLSSEGFKVNGSSDFVTHTSAGASAKGIRVEVSLSREAVYRARYDAGKIKVEISAARQDDEKRRKAESSAAKSPLTVQRVNIERRSGRERVVVETSGLARFRVVPGNKGPAHLIVYGARMASGLGPKVEGDERSNIRSVAVRQKADRVLIEAERAPGASATAIREGNRIVWLFADPLDKDAKLSAALTVAQDEAVEIDGQQVAAFLSDLPLQFGFDDDKRRYTGRRIDLDLMDADIHNILRLMSEVGNVNIVTADNVRGSVTIRMRNVAWDRALDVILRAKGLGKVRKGNLIRVAPLEVLEKERDMAIERQKQQIELAPLETRLIPVSYASAQEMSKQAGGLLSERGKISVDGRTNMMIVRDVSGNLDDVEELVRSLDSQTPQVLIEARIIEATSQFARDLGIQWGGSVVMSSATGNPTGLVFPHDVAFGGGADDPGSPTGGMTPFSASLPNPNFAVNMPAPAGLGEGGAIGLTMGSVSGHVNLNLRLSAAESSGYVRIISAPRVLTLDNKGANISQGTSIPYSQVSAMGVNTAFQSAVLKLSVTPHVTNDGAISMDVNISRNEPDFTQTSARGDPTILTRQAKTTLLVQDNHTAVIGGIYTRNSGSGVRKVPFFGDIPIIGLIFKQRSWSDNRNELLIFITPRIVNRAESLRR